MTVRGRALSARFGDRTLFAELDIAVASGQFLAIVGPNGAGKTTLLRGLAGLAPIEGSVELDEQPLPKLDARARARAVAYLPQQTPVAAGLRVDDVVMLGRLPHRNRFSGLSAADRRSVSRSLERLGLTTLATRTVESLSGGERQRVMLARMLATEARTLLLDEPIASLDIRHALALLRDLRALTSEGVAVVAVLHDLTLADHFADAAVCLHGDGTQSVGPPAEVFNPAHLQTVFGATFLRDDQGCLRLDFPASEGFSGAAKHRML